jgi:hypothetical protein
MYAEHKAEQEEDVARETEEVEDEVFAHEMSQIVARELETVVSTS